MKTCPRCRETKELVGFNRDRAKKDGFASVCRVCRIEINRKWYFENREKARELNRKMIAKDTEKEKNRLKKWRIDNLDKAREGGRISVKKRRNTLKGKLNDRMGSSIRESLKRGSKSGRHWENLVGFNLNQLKIHLEKQFAPGMTWKNYGLWHIDHEIPISAFNFDKPEHLDFKKCWALKNLRPLWAKDNIKKHNKLDRPFQPSLKM